MQITNNHTTIEITEDVLMAMICHPRVNDLEIIISNRFKCGFINVPKIGFYTQIYLCRVLLDLSAIDIADMYDVTPGKVNSIIKICHASLMVDEKYHLWLQSLYNEYQLKLKIAA